MRGSFTRYSHHRGLILGDDGRTYSFFAYYYPRLVQGQRVKFKPVGFTASQIRLSINENLYASKTLARIEALEREELEQESPTKSSDISNQPDIAYPSFTRYPPQAPAESGGILGEVALRIDAVDPAIARFLTFRFFGGLTLREIAARTGQPLTEVKREWQTAKDMLSAGGNQYAENLASNFVLLPPISKRDLRILYNHPELLKTLDWRSFERILADLLESLGYQIELQRGTKDGGIDIFALRNEGTFGAHRYIIQAKRWSHRVGIGPVRELLFLQNDLKATKSCLATTTSFTKGAWQLAGEYRWQLELRDLQGIREWISMAAESETTSISVK